MQWLLPALFVRLCHAQPSHAGSVRGEMHFAAVVPSRFSSRLARSDEPGTHTPQQMLCGNGSLAMEHPMTCRRPHTPGRVTPLRDWRTGSGLRAARGPGMTSNFARRRCLRCYSASASRTPAGQSRSSVPCVKNSATASRSMPKATQPVCANSPAALRRSQVVPKWSRW